MRGLIMMTAKRPRSQPNTDPLLVDFPTVCGLVAMSETKIRDLIAEGRFPRFVKVDGKSLFRYVDIVNFVNTLFGDDE